MMTEVPIEGAKPFNLRDGEHMLWVAHGKAAQDNREHLIDVCARVNAEVYGRDLEDSKILISREIVDLSIRPEGSGTRPENTTVVLMAPVHNPNQIVGYLTTREYRVPTSIGLVDTLYQTRAILKPFRNKKLGRSAVQQANIVNNGAQYDIFRTNNPIAIWSNAQSGAFGFNEDGSPKLGHPF